LFSQKKIIISSSKSKLPGQVANKRRERPGKNGKNVSGKVEVRVLLVLPSKPSPTGETRCVTLQERRFLKIP